MMPLYHQKRKPPRLNAAAQTTLQTRTRYCLEFTDMRPLYPMKRKNRAVRAALPKTHPKITRHKERRMRTIIGSLLPLSTKKPPGRLIPRRLANPDPTAEAASRYLQNVGRSCSKPQNRRGRHKKR